MAMTGNDTNGAIQALCMWRAAGHCRPPGNASASKFSTDDPAELHVVCSPVPSVQTGVGS